MRPKEECFCREYVIDFNATRAYVAAGYSPNGAQANASHLLERPDIKAWVDQHKERMAAKVDLQIADVVRSIVRVLRADPRELIEYRRGACRYCYGEGHLYQRTPAEEKAAFDAWQKALARDPTATMDYEGGVGFNPKLEPHPDCPECHGYGVEYVHARDVRHVSADAAELYLGTKPTANGIEILMADKAKARDQAARYLGMDKTVLNITTARAADLSDDELAAIIAIDKVAGNGT